MNYRRAKLLASYNAGVSDVKIIDIKPRTPISRLTIDYDVTVGAGDRIKHISAYFKGIKIVDGSTVILALDGTQLRALDYFVSRQPGKDFDSVNQSEKNSGRLVYDFGRFLYDQELAFDPTRFNNPQLEIEVDASLVEAGATDGNFTVYADLFDEKAITPQGFIRTYEIQRYSPSAGSWEYIDLPTDRVIRGLFMQAYSRGDGLAKYFNEVKLDEDEDARVIYNTELHDLVAMNGCEFGIVESAYSAKGASLDNKGAVIPCYSPHAGHIASDEGNVTNISMADGGHILVQTGVASNTVISGLAGGLVPLGVVYLPCGNLDEIGDWFSARDVGSLRLSIKGGSGPPAGETLRVFAQQLYRP